MEFLRDFKRFTAVQLGLILVASGAVVTVSSGVASATTVLYASAPVAKGTGTCASPTNACQLSTALNSATPGTTIELVTAGVEGNSSTYYGPALGVSTNGTSPASPVTVEPAPGVAQPIVDGAGTLNDDIAFSVSSGVFFDLSGVKVQHGAPAIMNDGGTVTVTHTTFVDNGSANGAAIDNAYGGGETGTVSISDCTFSDNAATDDGGAIDNGDDGGDGTLTISDSTFVGNNGHDGGAIDNADNSGTGSLTITDSTFSGNAGIGGGAIDNGDHFGKGTLVVEHSTFEENAGTYGEDLINGGRGGSSTTTVGADIFADTCDQAGGTWTDKGYNVGADTTCFDAGPGDNSLAGTSLRSVLGVLGSHGGPTATSGLLVGNPAIGNIPNPTSGLCPVMSDQRGIPGRYGKACDAGAVQLTGQRISFSPPSTGIKGQVKNLTATGGGSGNAVKFSIASTSGSGVCTLSGSNGHEVHFKKVGVCVIDANQAGNANFLAAAQVRKTIHVHR